MPVPPEQRLQFSVYTVESPSALDLYSARGEGDLIRQVTGLNLIPCTHRIAATRDTFVKSLTEGFEEHILKHSVRIPILHLSAHGDANCIGFTDGTQMSWEELKELLRPLNARAGGNLIVCMSSCQGYAGTRMAMYLEEEDYPYWALVGSSEEPTWGETAIAFATLYHQLHLGEYINDAVEAMKRASGNDTFILEKADASRLSFANFMQAQREANPAGTAAAVSTAGAVQPAGTS
jgi:hypothetical protein